MMTRRHIFLLLWGMLVLALFAWTVMSYGAQSDAQLKGELLLRHGLLMLALSLPAGWLLTGFIGALLHLVGLDLTGLADALLTSIACAVAGYVQWFVFVPWLWRKWRARREHVTAPSA